MIVPDPSEVYPLRAWVREYTIRSRPAIGAGARILAWWPRDERPWVTRRIQREIGLNDVEMDEVDRNAKFLEHHHPNYIDHSDAGLSHYLDTIEAAQELAFIARNIAMTEDQALRVFHRTLARYDLIDAPDEFADRVLSLVAFFLEWPPLILFHWETRQRQKLAAQEG